MKIKTAPGKVPNSFAMYKELRNVTLANETYAVKDFRLKRDAGSFVFKSGAFQFLAPVNGRVTGAVFSGDGEFELSAPMATERRSIGLLTKGAPLKEAFSSLVLRFTDNTFDEVRAAWSATPGSVSNAGDYEDIRAALKNKLKYNVSGRLLMDVITGKPGKFFTAFIKGKNYSGKEVFMIDPYGASWMRPTGTDGLDFAPEEVAFMTWDENKAGAWAAFHLEEEYKNGSATGTQKNAAIDAVEHSLDAQIEKSGKLNGDAITTFMSNVDRLQVIPFDLFPTLRVQSVTGEDGHALDFIQEEKDDDAQFYVVLDQPLKSGQTFAIRTVYSGKDAVSNDGGGNYFPNPGARADWYPNTTFGDFAKYEIRFRVPKKLTLIANGERTLQVDEGDETVTEWRSHGENTVAGFNVGKFKSETKQLANNFQIEIHANADVPDDLKGMQSEIDQAEQQGYMFTGALGTLNTVGMMKKILGEAEYSVGIYRDYFGETSFKRVSMTQQNHPGFGQSWPELVYMPISSFFDGTVRFQLLGFDPYGYFKVVGPHEVAHQWWGHTVGWKSYRDQWMSEGFSEFSASLFLQQVYGNKQFLDFWNDEKKLITEKNQYGFRANDVGPVIMGYRLNSSKTGSITQRLIYPKGGYILHMIRMMMWSPQKGDEAFKAMMRDFVATYQNRSASTEDFEAMVEKHMLPGMDVDGNKKMDWFFNQFVYGTALPNYDFTSSFSQGAEGTVLNFKITQSGVDPNFKMLVPIYLELNNNRVIRLGAAVVTGNSSLEQSVPLKGLKEPPKRAMLNYYNDVLSISEK